MTVYNPSGQDVPEISRVESGRVRAVVRTLTGWTVSGQEVSKYIAVLSDQEVSKYITVLSDQEVSKYVMEIYHGNVSWKYMMEVYHGNISWFCSGYPNPPRPVKSPGKKIVWPISATLSGTRHYHLTFPGLSTGRFFGPRYHIPQEKVLPRNFTVWFVRDPATTGLNDILLFVWDPATAVLPGLVCSHLFFSVLQSVVRAK